MIAPIIKAIVKKVFKRALLFVGKKLLKGAIVAFLARYTVKLVAPTFKKLSFNFKSALADKADDFSNKLKMMAVTVAGFFDFGGGGSNTSSGGGSVDSDTLSGEERSAERELEGETASESDNTALVIAVSSAVLTSSLAYARKETKDMEFNLPNIFPLPEIRRTARSKEDTFGFRKRNTGRQVSVVNSENFKYKNTQMSSALYANPLNVRPSRTKSGEIRDDYWEGQTGHYWTGNGDFMSFSDPFYSFRAAATTIMTYQKRDNKHSVRDWIYTYCPQYDEYAGLQQTHSYVADVVGIINRTGLFGAPIDENTQLDITDRNTFIGVMKGMAWHESHLDVSVDYLSRVYDAMFLGMPIPLQTGEGYYAENSGGTYVVTRSVVTSSNSLQASNGKVKRTNTA